MPIDINKIRNEYIQTDPNLFVDFHCGIRRYEPSDEDAFYDVELESIEAKDPYASIKRLSHIIMERDETLSEKWSVQKVVNSENMFNGCKLLLNILFNKGESYFGVPQELDYSSSG